ncbi:hypothetical protein M8332_07080 (plasmid) [Fructilactobacillus ixorae]|uniref:Uncharacterized protein n=1 Tax=Fructilactobacillus ixorae TaxID=1750535 RepID=A0ABY5C5D3_9LACO|nr:hypothetical protein [Fructilactobacillus ixorae]USS93979.1 hypothetical protein M8332_07080 [Fructilactobacillus ixorae]
MIENNKKIQEQQDEIRSLRLSLKKAHENDRIAKRENNKQRILLSKALSRIDAADDLLNTANLYWNETTGEYTSDKQISFVELPIIPTWVEPQLKMHKKAGEPHVSCFIKNLYANAKDSSQKRYIDKHIKAIQLAYTLDQYVVDDCSDFQFVGVDNE